ncbi:hypothetical protein ACJ73_07228 [Blastomyces percursus]|uniref:Uncharacterized protein n=1 Tax=Blastomyces percursus TaxID=1658174 RepID=A0A1J9PYN5_9EURO|nr:hypothetical protein ACJ73_07228 [Blastomyces percursus]
MVVLEVQGVVGYTPQTARRLPTLNPPFRPFELIAMEDEMKYISITQVIDQLDVYVDTTFESDFDLSVEYEGRGQYFLRRVMRTKTGVVEVWPYCKSSPIRAELEISAHGRDLLENIFCSDIQVISLPYQLFVDGFGLYRNMYRSSMSFYMIPALSAVERSKRNNIFTLTFGPHGTNVPDTITALSHGLPTLDCKGVMVDIGEEKLRVVASCIAFLGDMPQQNSNAGIKGPTTRRSCRSCFIDDKNRPNLDYDLRNNGRFHHHMQHFQSKLDDLPNPARRDQMCQEQGITAQAQEYFRMLQTFPFPRGWNRLQSPITHLKKDQLQEHARASIIIPLVLRCGLREEWLSPAIKQTIPTAFSAQNQSPIDLIIQVHAAIARSNNLLVSQSPRENDPEVARQIILGARRQLQFLIEAAARAAATFGPSRAGSVVSRQPSPAPTMGTVVRIPAIIQKKQSLYGI